MPFFSNRSTVEKVTYILKVIHRHVTYLIKSGLFLALSYHTIVCTQSYPIGKYTKMLYLKNPSAWGDKYDKYIGIVESKYYVTKSKNELSYWNIWASRAPKNVNVLSKIWNHEQSTVVCVPCNRHSEIMPSKSVNSSSTCNPLNSF